MANASSGLFTPTLRMRVSQSIGSSTNRPGFCQIDGFSKRVVVCSSTSRGSENVSPSSVRMPRIAGKGCKLIGCGSAVPSKLVSNDDLAKIVETNDEWIFTRTGIHNRRILSGNETLTGLAVEAAQKALQMAKVDPDDVDLILCCTSSPDDLFGNATLIQKELGCKNYPLAFDITAACSGFILGLVSASFYIQGGGFKNVLVVGADALSGHVDWSNRNSCILFGDGAGAVLVQACDSEEHGLFGFDLHSDGEGIRNLNAGIKAEENEHGSDTNGLGPGFPPTHSSYSCIEMNGKEVFRFAVRVVPPSIEAALVNSGLTRSNIDWLLLHQANKRIIDGVATRLELPPEKIILNLENLGNTSAASIPLALDEAVRSGKVQPGHIIATAGFGAGLTWGSVIIRWN